jgi:hypothetical protein
VRRPLDPRFRGDDNKWFSLIGNHFKLAPMGWKPAVPGAVSAAKLDVRERCAGGMGCDGESRARRPGHRLSTRRFVDCFGFSGRHGRDPRNRLDGRIRSDGKYEHPASSSASKDGLYGTAKVKTNLTKMLNETLSSRRRRRI